MRTGDLVVQLYTEQTVELEAENWRLCSTTLVRGVAGELEDLLLYSGIFVFLFGRFSLKTKKVNLDAKSIFNYRLPLKKCVHVMLHLSSSAQRQNK